MLRGHILNEKMTPSEFQSSFDNYIGRVRQLMKITEYYMKQGFSGDQLGAAIDKRFKLPEQEKVEYARKLRAQGLSPKQIYDRLVEEGFIGE